MISFNSPKNSGKTSVILCESFHEIDPKTALSIQINEKFYIYLAPLTTMNTGVYNDLEIMF